LFDSALKNTNYNTTPKGLQSYGSWEFIDSLNDQSIAAPDVGL